MTNPTPDPTHTLDTPVEYEFILTKVKLLPHLTKLLKPMSLKEEEVTACSIMLRCTGSRDVGESTWSAQTEKDGTTGKFHTDSFFELLCLYKETEVVVKGGDKKEEKESSNKHPQEGSIYLGNNYYPFLLSGDYEQIMVIKSGCTPYVRYSKKNGLPFRTTSVLNGGRILWHISNYEVLDTYLIGAEPSLAGIGV